MKLLLLKLRIYLKGIRFYRSDLEPLNDEFKVLSVETIDNKFIKFYFHEDEYTDFIYKRGKIEKITFKTHTIRAIVDETFDDKLLSFNNLKIVFKSDEFSYEDRDKLIKVLLKIFLNFMKKELSNKLK